MGPQNGPGMTRFFFHNKIHASHPVQYKSCENFGEAFRGMEVLGQRKKTVSEVEISFARTAVGQRTTTQMIHHRFGNRSQDFSTALYAPTQIDFFHVRKIPAIQSTAFPKNLGSNSQAGSARPKYPVHSLVLSQVFLQILKNPTDAKGVTQGIHHPTGRSGVFKGIPLAVRENFGLQSPHRSILKKSSVQWLQPIGLDLHIRI